jgi:hypothetical protein
MHGAGADGRRCWLILVGSVLVNAAHASWSIRKSILTVCVGLRQIQAAVVQDLRAAPFSRGSAQGASTSMALSDRPRPAGVSYPPGGHTEWRL